MKNTILTRQGLLRLCEIAPPKISYAIWKILCSLPIIATIYYHQEIIEFTKESRKYIEWENGFGDKILIILIILVIIGAIILSIYLLYVTIDGLSSLLPKDSEDGIVYCHNDGFTTKSNALMRMFGKKIYPISTVEELENHQGNLVFLNDVTVLNVHVQEEEDFMMIGTVPMEVTEYTAKINATLQNKPIQIYTETDDDDFIDSLKELKKGEKIYVVGTIDEDNEIDIDRFGNTL